MVLGTVVRTAMLLGSHNELNDSSRFPECVRSEERVRRIVDELCSSLPYCFGIEASFQASAASSSNVGKRWNRPRHAWS